ncbi:molybdate ABC transporter permease subunit [Pendulispora rubella]|uniref:Molybdenum transport system permease n=1 Tax=Pendulispora rubella TaxID=2741070 RepID=A0ABZ2LJ07_9BACT
MSPLALSLFVATGSTLLAAVVGLAMATLLATRRFPGRALLDVLVTVPMVMPPTVLGYYLLVLLGRRGPIGQAFEALTGSSIVFTRTGAVVAAAIGALPIVIKSGRAALEDVDPQLVFAARTLGASAWRAFLTVRLPLAGRGIIAALMLAFARALGDFGVTLMVAGNIPGETQTASLAIFDAILAQRDDEALSLVIVLSLVAIAVLYTVNKLTERRRA